MGGSPRSTVLRHGSRRKWLTVDRRAINDARLSFRARGVLAWLLDKPDDWQWNSDTLAGEGTEGRDAIRKALAELTEFGYLVRARRQTGGGHWVTESIVYEDPADAHAPTLLDASPTPENPAPVDTPTPGKPTPGKPTAGIPGPNPLATDTETGANAGTIAQGIVRDWWDGFDPKPMQPFAAVVVIVASAIKAGHEGERVKGALGRCPLPVTKWQLERELTQGKGARAPLADPDARSRRRRQP